MGGQGKQVADGPEDRSLMWKLSVLRADTRGEGARVDMKDRPLSSTPGQMVALQPPGGGEGRAEQGWWCQGGGKGKGMG